MNYYILKSLKIDFKLFYGGKIKMYTWGYLKENILAKLNLDEESANQQNFLSNFPYYANEAMTQICSAIKAKDTEFSLYVYDEDTKWKEMTSSYGLYTTTDHYTPDNFTIDDPLYTKKTAFWAEWNSLYFTGTEIVMPEDFVAFDDDVPTYQYREVFDDTLEYRGYNHIICKDVGYYQIPYRARWFFFTKDLQNDDMVTAPADVCDAIPLYVVSQCYKIDDDTKASIFRNEYEVALARIDDTTFKRQRTFDVTGGW